MDQVAPWFPVSGHFTVPSWEKLGKDLRFAEEQGVLPKGVLLVWKLVRNCIEDRERCGAELLKGEVSGNLTKIVQGPTEPCADFVATIYICMDLACAHAHTWADSTVHKDH